LAEKPKYYWDACAWIALIQQEQGRIDSLKYVIGEAQNGKVEIWTSNFTLAEVFKRNCGSGSNEEDQRTLLPQQDRTFEDFILQNFVERVQVDYDVGVLARQLLRAYPGIKKPQDGIHLATALLNNIDELHTFDRANLLDLSLVIERRDGKKLKICHPPNPPKPKPLPLFEQLEEKPDEPPKAAEGGAPA
jgi:predicted nucleic acid-binding protein